MNKWDKLKKEQKTLVTKYNRSKSIKKKKELYISIQDIEVKLEVLKQ